MISKVVPADSVYHTCRYIFNKPGSEVLATDGVREFDWGGEDMLVAKGDDEGVKV